MIRTIGLRTCRKRDTIGILSYAADGFEQFTLARLNEFCYSSSSRRLLAIGTCESGRFAGCETREAGIVRAGKESGMSTIGKDAICVHIRWMIRRDMPEVLGIERQSFEFPWSEDEFVRCLRQRNCIGMVAEHDERIVGFMIYELHKNRLHILNFAVRAEFRRRGVGSQMIRKLAGKLSQQRRNRILLEVRETNLPAQLFFRSSGFRAISLLREFYEDTPEDAYLMQFQYETTAADQMVDEVRRRAS